MRRFSRPSPVVDIELLESVKGSGLAPAVELSASAVYVAGCELDEWEVEATGRARVVGEDPVDDGGAPAKAAKEAAISLKVEGRGAPKVVPSAGEGLRACAVLGGEKGDDGTEDGVGEAADGILGNPVAIVVATACPIPWPAASDPIGFALSCHGGRCRLLHGWRQGRSRVWAVVAEGRVYLEHG